LPSFFIISNTAGFKQKLKTACSIYSGKGLLEAFII